MKRFLPLLFLFPLAFVRAEEVAPPSKTVIVFGDSITEGNMLPPDEKNQLWLPLVEKQSKGRLHLINEGRGGRPTASLPEFDSMLKRCATPAPDLLVIALGMNDSRDLSAASVPKAVENVRAMIDKAHAVWGAALPILLVGPSNLNKDSLGASKPIADPREAKLKKLNTAFASLAKETSSAFVSLFGVVPPTSLLKDGVHPDAAGNAAIAAVLFPVFTSLLYSNPTTSPAP